MRIIGGEHGGRKIKEPKLKTTRPTKDRVREAVFNVIAGEVDGAKVLDTFAGSGAYGLEALSRGAENVVFIEKNTECAGIIEENIQLLGVSGFARVIADDVFDSVRSLAENRERFDLIFSDPPYNSTMVRKVLIMTNHYDILTPAGLLIVEHSASEDIPELDGNVSILKQKSYGDISITVFRKND